MLTSRIKNTKEYRNIYFRLLMQSSAVIIIIFFPKGPFHENILRQEVYTFNHLTHAHETRNSSQYARQGTGPEEHSESGIHISRENSGIINITTPKTRRERRLYLSDKHQGTLGRSNHFAKRLFFLILHCIVKK